MNRERPASYLTERFEATDLLNNVRTIAPTNIRTSVRPDTSAFDTTSTPIDDDESDIEMGQILSWPEEDHYPGRAPSTDRNANTTAYSRFKNTRFAHRFRRPRSIYGNPGGPKLLYWPNGIVGCSLLLRLMISVSYGSFWFSSNCGMSQGFCHTSTVLGITCLWEIAILCLYQIASNRRKLLTTGLLALCASLWIAVLGIFWGVGLDSFGQCGHLVSWIYPGSPKHS